MSRCEVLREGYGNTLSPGVSGADRRGRGELSNEKQGATLSQTQNLL